MPGAKQRKLDSTVALLNQRHGAGTVRKASQLAAAGAPPAISTGVAQLDAATGCNGVPLGCITLLSGRVTSGKMTLAYLILASAQVSPGGQPSPVAILDLAHNCDPDYAQGCGVDPAQLLLVRPHPGPEVVDLLSELVRRHSLQAILVNSLPDLTYHRSSYLRLNAALPALTQLVRSAGTALIFLDDVSPPWQRWLNWDRSWAVRQRAGLHLQMTRERLVETGQQWGYAARARVLHSRWPRPGYEPLIQILMNDHVTIDGQPRPVRPPKAGT